MTDKQRLDAYVLAAMTACADPSDSDYIWHCAKKMMEYVDAQEVEVKSKGATENWIKNTGSMPVKEGVEVEVRLGNGKEYNDTAGAFYWKVGDGNGHITHWRKAQ